ncbi:MAG: 3-phosphoshikimate 1-carboxyvinyltransferase [Oscillospiraceae bacterium]|nr:3-phosphoshikimate 1-carboxyvinyltransferase [Oscillospiraceae bacterium]
MDLKITPGKLAGTVTPPPAKTLQHRIIIAAALAGHFTEPTEQMSDDLRATAVGVKQLLTEEKPRIVCGGSGSTLRLLLPLAMRRGGAEFVCNDELINRPLPPYVTCEREGNVLRPTGALPSGIYPVPGNGSAHYISALLFALPLAEGNSTVTLTTPLEMPSAVEMTLAVLQAFGITIEKTHNGYFVPGGQKYVYCDMGEESDWAFAALYHVMNALGSDITVEGTKIPTLQADSIIAELVKSDLPQEINVGDVPDLVPPLALLAALKPNRMTVLHHAGRLRLKETDRLHTVSATLRDLGATVIYTGETLFIFGHEDLRGGDVSSRGDHRIAMMAAAAATCCTGEVIIRGAECVNKSYPRFWSDLAALGMKIEEV